MVYQAVDRTETRTCAKKTLGCVMRTGILLAGAVLASVLMVELPLTAGRGADRPYVPASDTWIELGGAARHEALPRPEAPPQADTPTAAADPAAAAARDLDQAQHRPNSRAKPQTDSLFKKPAARLPG